MVQRIGGKLLLVQVMLSHSYLYAVEIGTVELMIGKSHFLLS